MRRRPRPRPGAARRGRACGDELPALLDDAGLTCRIVADVAAGATVERVRALIALRNRPGDPIAEARALARSGREVIIDMLAFGALVLMTVGALAAAGVLADVVLVVLDVLLAVLGGWYRASRRQPS